MQAKVQLPQHNHVIQLMHDQGGDWKWGKRGRKRLHKSMDACQ